MKSLILGLVAGGALVLRASMIYQVVDLGGSAAGGASSQASAISAGGRTAGWVADGRGRIRATADGMPLEISRESRAYGINDAGQTVGIRFDALGNAQAVIWNTDGSVSLLGGASASSYAMDINASGRVAGAVDGRAAVWAPGSAAASTLAVGRSVGSAAMAVNSAGVVAGTAQLADGSFQAFTSGANGMFYGYLGTLGGTSSYAQAMNDMGWVAGGSTIAQGYLRAFVYFGGLMRNLGTLGAGNSSAYGVNNAGQVVGYAQTATGDSAAFLWENNRMVDLNSLIAEDSGWRLLEASGINDRGQIVGRGLLGGVERAFRLDPTIASVQTLSTASLGVPGLAADSSYLLNPVPEPATWIMAALGLGAVAFGVMRRPPAA